MSCGAQAASTEAASRRAASDAGPVGRLVGPVGRLAEAEVMSGLQREGREGCAHRSAGRDTGARGEGGAMGPARRPDAAAGGGAGQWRGRGSASAVPPMPRQKPGQRPVRRQEGTRIGSARRIAAR
ncbi:hypothetical protein KNE206_51970 [Kitasatospora sp. NE20-6]